MGKDKIWTKSLFIWDASVWSAAESGGADMVALMFHRETQKIQEIPKQKCNIMLQKKQKCNINLYKKNPNIFTANRNPTTIVKTCAIGNSCFKNISDRHVVQRLSVCLFEEVAGYIRYIRICQIYISDRCVCLFV